MPKDLIHQLGVKAWSSMWCMATECWCHWIKWLNSWDQHNECLWGKGNGILSKLRDHESYLLFAWFVENYFICIFSAHSMFLCSFTVVAVVDGYPYTRVRAGCKRDCRSGAAYLAWKAIIHSQQEQASCLQSLWLPYYFATSSTLDNWPSFVKNKLGYLGDMVTIFLCICESQFANIQHSVLSSVFVFMCILFYLAG